jgi:hypothetical protein
MAQKKAKEFKVEFFKNVNECWTGTAYLADPVNMKTYDISYSVAPGTKALTARAEIKRELNERVAEFIAEHPNFVRMEKADADKIYWASRGRK